MWLCVCEMWQRKYKRELGFADVVRTGREVGNERYVHIRAAFDRTTGEFGQFFKPLSGATLDFILLLKQPPLFVRIVKSAHLHTYSVVFQLVPSCVTSVYMTYMTVSEM